MGHQCISTGAPWHICFQTKGNTCDMLESHNGLQACHPTKRRNYRIQVNLSFIQHKNLNPYRFVVGWF